MAVKVKTLSTVTVITPGVRKPLSTKSMLVYGVTIQSLPSNSGNQYFGDETVDSDNGIEFDPGDIIEVDGPPSPKGQEQFDLSTIYVDSDTAGAEFRVVAWIRV